MLLRYIFLYKNEKKYIDKSILFKILETYDEIYKNFLLNTFINLIDEDFGEISNQDDGQYNLKTFINKILSKENIIIYLLKVKRKDLLNKLTPVLKNYVKHYLSLLYFRDIINPYVLKSLKWSFKNGLIEKETMENVLSYKNSSKNKYVLFCDMLKNYIIYDKKL